MKIVYFLTHETHQYDGVLKKIENQINEWELNGNTVYVVLYGNGLCVNGKDYLRIEYNNHIHKRLVVDHLVIDHVNEINPDILYIRDDGGSRTMTKLCELYPTIVEVNTDIKEEMLLGFVLSKKIAYILSYLYLTVFYQAFLKKVSLVIFVTYELSKRFKTKKSSVLPNSINFNDYDNIKEVNTFRRKSLVFLGKKGCVWHGVDKIQELATHLIQYDFHIVGEEVEENSLANVYSHGYMDRSKYIEILKYASVCIGTLALYRKGMDEACPLKTREYLASGFPTIIGYNDTSFLDDLPDYILKIDTRNHVNTYLDKVASFIEKNEDYIVPKSSISNLDSKRIEAERISLMLSIIDKHA